VRARYFAYGSNLKLSRMRERVPAAEVVAPALLRGRRLTLDKRGADGSGKANLAPDRGALVWGVVYAFRAETWTALDAFEPDYERVEVAVELSGVALRAVTYASERITRDPVPHDWYKRLIVEGAREHGLPAEWIARLEALPARSAGPGPARAEALGERSPARR
jgi:gamma-glutamylcyclotransferase (GGCT)/AIG2-like uncharacterized protein YtfP